jgi:hypothetical protein
VTDAQGEEVYEKGGYSPLKAPFFTFSDISRNGIDRDRELN